MVEINLHNAEFFAHHGYYREEQLLGCPFLVDISVRFTPTGDLSEDEIAHTVNYERLYIIACEEMSHTRKLIETVAQSIFNRIAEKYPYVKAIRVTVKKMNPPMKGKVGHTSVVIDNY